MDESHDMDMEVEIAASNRLQHDPVNQPHSSHLNPVNTHENMASTLDGSSFEDSPDPNLATQHEEAINVNPIQHSYPGYEVNVQVVVSGQSSVSISTLVHSAGLDVHVNVARQKIQSDAVNDQSFTGAQNHDDSNYGITDQAYPIATTSVSNLDTQILQQQIEQQASQSSFSANQDATQYISNLETQMNHQQQQQQQQQQHLENQILQQQQYVEQQQQTSLSLLSNDQQVNTQHTPNFETQILQQQQQQITAYHINSNHETQSIKQQQHQQQPSTSSISNSTTENNINTNAMDLDTTTFPDDDDDLLSWDPTQDPGFISYISKIDNTTTTTTTKSLKRTDSDVYTSTKYKSTSIETKAARKFVFPSSKKNGAGVDLKETYLAKFKACLVDEMLAKDGILKDDYYGKVVEMGGDEEDDGEVGGGGGGGGGFGELERGFRKVEDV
ncbi:hypothetical protein HDU76_006342 [Blyttiomyces sp. JEL0837]|nr:hypothetical protein HDU76_006342 [Blyttiomyces sp. JEL0837]